MPARVPTIASGATRKPLQWLTALAVWLVPATAAAQQDLATGLLHALLLAGALSVVALLALVWGMAELLRLRREPVSERTRRWAPRLGWANGLLGFASAIGAAVAVPRSADGWKLIPVAVALLVLGLALLVSSRRDAR